MNEIRKKRKMNDGIRSSRKKTKTIKKTGRFVLDENQEIKKKKLKLVKHRRKIKKIKKEESKEKLFQKKNKIIDKPFLKILDFFKTYKILFKWFVYVGIYFSILFIIFNTFEKTKVTLIPRTESIEDVTSVNVFLNPKYNELGFDIIVLSDSREKNLLSQESLAVSEKASGIIKIFNNYSTEPQRLAPFTRFESVSGKIFKLGEKNIEIPGKTADKPGSIDVVVYAEKPGPEYNIDLSDFTIPGFKESGLMQKYNNIYALSLKSFSGGFKGQRLVVGENQKNKSISELELEIKKSLMRRLELEKTDKVLLVKDSVQILFKEPVVNQKNNKYVLRQDAQLFALLIEKKQLEKYLKKRYLSSFNNQDASLDSFNNIIFNYKGDTLDFLNLKKVNLSMNIKGSFVWNLDIDLLKESLLGLAKNDVSTILKEFDEIQSAKIKIRPFWKKNISSNINNIKIER